MKRIVIPLIVFTVFCFFDWKLAIMITGVFYIFLTIFFTISVETMARKEKKKVNLLDDLQRDFLAKDEQLRRAADFIITQGLKASHNRHSFGFEAIDGTQIRYETLTQKLTVINWGIPPDKNKFNDIDLKNDFRLYFENMALQSKSQSERLIAIMDFKGQMNDLWVTMRDLHVAYGFVSVVILMIMMESNGYSGSILFFIFTGYAALFIYSQLF